MLGLGASELLVIIVIALVLFGAPVLTFLAGYALGRKKAQASSDVHDALVATSEPIEEKQIDA